MDGVDPDPMEAFRIILSLGERREAISRSLREREEEEYMDGVRREVVERA